MALVAVFTLLQGIAPIVVKVMGVPSVVRDQVQDIGAALDGFAEVSRRIAIELATPDPALTPEQSAATLDELEASNQAARERAVWLEHQIALTNELAAASRQAAAAQQATIGQAPH